MAAATDSALISGLKYKGREGQWAWILHRVAGLGVLLFVLLHVFDIFLIGFGRATFEDLLFLYHSPIGRFLEVFLIFGVLFHALNGLRIIILDFWPDLMKYQQRLVWATVVVFLIIFLPMAVITLTPIFTGGA